MALLSLGGVCLLLSCLAAAAGNDVPVIPMTELEDNDVVLSCSLGSQSIRENIFNWKKDGKEVFMYDPAYKTDIYGRGQRNQDPQFKGRVFYFSDHLDSGNASIKIQKALVKDSGNYECIYVDRSQGGIQMTVSRISLTVGCILKDRTNEKVDGICPEPYIHVNIRAGMSNLQCQIKGAFPKPTIEWQDSNQHLVEGAVETKFKQNENGRFDRILEISVTQSGTYYCIVTQEAVCHQTQQNTTVWIPGGTVKPFVTSLKTAKGMMVQCEILDVPPQTKVQWQDSSGMLLPAEAPQVSQKGGNVDITLLAPITHRDSFFCVITQPDNKQISAKIDVDAPEASPSKESHNGFVIAIVVLVLLVIFLLCGLVLVCRRRR